MEKSSSESSLSLISTDSTFSNSVSVNSGNSKSTEWDSSTTNSNCAHSSPKEEKREENVEEKAELENNDEKMNQNIIEKVIDKNVNSQIQETQEHEEEEECIENNKETENSQNNLFNDDKIDDHYLDIPVKTSDEEIGIRPNDHHEYNAILKPSHFSLNHDWLLHSFSETPNEYFYLRNKEIVPPEAVKMHNELHLSDDDTNKYKDQIPIDEILSFLNQEKPKTDHEKLSDSLNITSFYQKKNIRVYPKKEKKFIKLSVGRFLLYTKESGAQSGYFALYNKKDERIITIPNPFEAIDKEHFAFPHTSGDSVYFPVETISPDIQLLCVIYAPDPSTFGLEKVYCLNTVPLFDENGEFLAPKEFTGGFVYTINGSITSTIKSLNNRDNLRQVNFPFDISTELVDDIEGDPSYIWSMDNTLPLRSCKIPRGLAYPRPIITISNISLTFKTPSKVPYYQMKAYLFEQTESRGIEPGDLSLFISNSGPKLEKCYTSPLMEANMKMDFPDFIHISVNHELSPMTHIVFQFHEYGGKEKNNGIIDWMATIPLFHNGIPYSNKQMKVALLGTKILPKDYYTKPKVPGIKTFTCNIDVPQALVLHPSLVNFPNAEITDIPKNVLFENIVPIVENCAYSLNPNAPKRLFELCSKLTQENIDNIILSWIHKSFNPNAFESSCHINRIAETFTPFFNSMLENNDTDVLRSFLETCEKVLPIICRIIMVSVSTEGLLWDQKAVTDFLCTIPKIIGCHMNVVREYPPVVDSKKKKKGEVKEVVNPIVRELNDEFKRSSPVKLVDIFAETINTIIPFTEGKYFLRVVHQFLYQINEYEHSSNEAINMKYLKIRFLNEIASKKKFVLEAAEQCIKGEFKPKINFYTPVISGLMHTIYNCLVTQIPAIIKDVGLILTKMCIAVEDCPEEKCNHVAVSLIPSLTLIYENISSKIVNNNMKILTYFLIPVLFILEYAPNELSSYFVVLEGHYQKRTILFLGNLMLNVVNMICEDSEQENLGTKMLLTGSKIILTFFSTAAKAFKNCLDDIISLFFFLLGPYQSASILPYFFDVIKRLTENFDDYNDIIKWLFELVKKKQHATRCFAAASLIQIFKEDFRKTGSINISSTAILDSFTDAVMKNSDDFIPILKLYMKQVAAASEKGKLKELIEERVEASYIIAECIMEQRHTEKPLDQACRTVMRIADQYHNLPSMRYKWLKQILEMNIKGGDLISAYITQLHIVALISSVVDFMYFNDNRISADAPRYHKQYEMQPLKDAEYIIQTGHMFDKKDFEFMPDLSKELSHKYEESMRKSSLLTEFTIDVLIDEINQAINLGKESSMYYVNRELYTLLIRIAYINKNYKRIDEVYNDFAKDEKIISTDGTKLNESIFFYLIEERKDGNSSRKVFCTHLDMESFISMISSQYEEGTCKLCKNHTSKSCNCNGVCVIPIEPIETMINNRYAYCFNTFRNKIDIKEYNHEDINQMIEIFTIKTENYSPHYRMSVDVESYQKKEVLLTDYIVDEIHKYIKNVRKCTSEFSAFYVDTKSTCVTPFAYISKDTERIDALINELIEENSIGRFLIMLNEAHFDVSSIYDELIEQFNLLMSFYLRSKKEKEEPTEEMEQKVFHFFEKIGKKESIRMEIYNGSSDPMEKEYSFFKEDPNL